MPEANLIPIPNWPASVLHLVLFAVVAYFCGCLNGAVIVSKYILKDDIRNHGSGNAGLTNFHRTFGGRLTAAVLLLDVVKMVAAVWLAAWVTARLVTPNWLPLLMGVDCAGVYDWQIQWVAFAKFWAGLWCLLGHMFPVTFGFKGGKGVLSGVTLMFCLDWRMGLIALGIFLIAVALTRYISLGSCLGAASFPVSTWLFVSREPAIVAMSVLLGGLVIFMHRGNLKRLVKGEERRFSLHKKRD